MNGFRLQTVLRVRKQREDLAQQYLAEARRREHQLQERMASEKERLQTLHRDMQDVQGRGVDPHQLMLFEQCIQSSRQSCVDLARELVEAEAHIQERQDALLEASREKKLVEKLKDRHDMRAWEEARQAENALMDEIANGAYARALAQEGKK